VSRIVTSTPAHVKVWSTAYRRLSGLPRTATYSASTGKKNRNNAGLAGVVERRWCGSTPSPHCVVLDLVGV